LTSAALAIRASETDRSVVAIVFILLCDGQTLSRSTQNASQQENFFHFREFCIVIPNVDECVVAHLTLQSL
jgi:hypothetical protein